MPGKYLPIQKKGPEGVDYCKSCFVTTCFFSGSTSEDCPIYRVIKKYTEKYQHLVDAELKRERREAPDEND